MTDIDSLRAENEALRLALDKYINQQLFRQFGETVKSKMEICTAFKNLIDSIERDNAFKGFQFYPPLVEAKKILEPELKKIELWNQ